MKYPIAEIEATAIGPGLALLPTAMDSRKARVMIRSTFLQESRMKYRAQIVDGGGKGPARGLGQFERGGGVKGVLTHPASKALAQSVCASRRVSADPRSVWLALETDDVLAAAFARLLLWTDPRPLPELSDTDGAWDCYVRNWRPGKPHRKTWDEFHRLAVEFRP